MTEANNTPNTTPLSEIFNLPETVQPKKTPALPEADVKDLAVDFDAARSDLLSVIAKAEEVTNEISTLATSAQNARIYEVLNQILNTRVAASQALLKLYEQRTVIAGKRPKESSSPSYQQTNNYIGSPANLFAAIKDMTEKNKMKDVTPK